MPGGSPFFPTARDIEALYTDLEVLFKLASQTCQAVTLKEFHHRFIANLSCDFSQCAEHSDNYWGHRLIHLKNSFT